MDQTFVNFALAGFSSLLGWWASEMWAAVKELKADLAKLREALPREYVVKNDYREDVREIKDMLKQLFEHFHKNG